MPKLVLKETLRPTLKEIKFGDGKGWEARVTYDGGEFCATSAAKLDALKNLARCMRDAGYPVTVEE